jgi:hypothetical protein
MPEKPKTSGYSIAAAKKYLKDNANWSDKKIAAFVRQYPKDYANKLINAVAAHRRAMTAQNSNKTAIAKTLDAQRAANPTDGSIPTRPQTDPPKVNKSAPPTTNRSTPKVVNGRQALDLDEVRKTGQGNRQSAEGVKAAASKKRHSGENKGAGGTGGMGRNNSPSNIDKPVAPKSSNNPPPTSRKAAPKPKPRPAAKIASGTPVRGRDSAKAKNGADNTRTVKAFGKKIKIRDDYDYPGDKY